MAGGLGSSFATAGHNLHRLRRSALNPFFSKRSIANNEALIREKVEHLCRRLEQCRKDKEIVRFDAAFMALYVGKLLECELRADLIVEQWMSLLILLSEEAMRCSKSQTSS